LNQTSRLRIDGAISTFLLFYYLLTVRTNQSSVMFSFVRFDKFDGIHDLDFIFAFQMISRLSFSVASRLIGSKCAPFYTISAQHRSASTTSPNLNVNSHVSILIKFRIVFFSNRKL
jgi:hypothetical protein